MPRKQIVAVNLAKKTVTQKIEFGRTVVSAMTVAVATFATPVPSLSSVTSNINTLEASVMILDGSHAKVAAKNAAERNFDLKITQLANYVNNIANGDGPTILLSGFQAKTNPSPIGPLDAPQNFSAKRTAVPGTVNLRWKRKYGAGSYNIYQSVDGARYVSGGQSTKTKFTVVGLTAGTIYFFKISAIGAAGEGAATEAVQIIA